MWCVDEVGMSEVFGTENSLLYGDAPVDAECLILDVDARLCLGVVEVVTLVLEYCGLGKYCETVCKASRYEKLQVIVFAQFYCYMLTEGW